MTDPEQKMGDVDGTAKASSFGWVLGWTLGCFASIKRIIWRGMYKRKGKLRRAVNFGYGREIDTANDIGSRLSSPIKTSQRTNDVRMIGLLPW